MHVVLNARGIESPPNAERRGKRLPALARRRRRSPSILRAIVLLYDILSLISGKTRTFHSVYDLQRIVGVYHPSARTANTGQPITSAGTVNRRRDNHVDTLDDISSRIYWTIGNMDRQDRSIRPCTLKTYLSTYPLKDILYELSSSVSMIF